MLKDVPLVGAISQFEVSLMHPVSGVFKSKQHILLPHMLFAYLFHRYRDAFLQYVAGSQRKLEQWWKDQQDSPQYLEHPVRLRAGHFKSCIPVAFHGDGVTCLDVGQTGSKSWETFSWCSLTGEGGSALMCNNLVWTYPKHCTAPTTRSTFFKMMRWSFDILYDGQWPRADWTGK
eukprot:9063642-Pyramimonas_sp.AAC.1